MENNKIAFLVEGNQIKSIIDFIESHGDVAIDGNIQYIHLPQWISINKENGCIEIGLPKGILPSDLLDSAKRMSKKRHK